VADPTIALPEEDVLFRLLRQLDAAPDASQRATAEAMGVSLGRLNALLRASTSAGLVQITEKQSADRRQRASYLLTPRGAAEKARLADRFLARKFAEYNALHAELTGSASPLAPPKTRTLTMQSHLTPVPELYVSYDSAQKLKMEAADLPSWDLTPRQVCDLELLMNGGFNPLKGFMGQADYDSVVEKMRMADGTLWPMPVTLDVSEAFADAIEPGQDIALRDAEGVILAILSISDKWSPDKAREAEKVYGADDIAHPAVYHLHHNAGPVYLGGAITGIQPPTHYDFRARRDTPNELRAYFRKLGWRRVVAFQTRNPLHRAHQELTFRAAKEAQANLLIHPVVGMTKPGDVDHFTRVRCYEAVLDQYPSATTHMSLLNLAMRMAGPREAVWHGLIRKNHGCTHMIVGRDHAGPGKNSAGEDFYGPYDAQELFREHQEEIGIEMVDFKQMVYVQERAQYEPADEIADKDDVTILNISGTELRRRLREGLEIPEWFSFPRGGERAASHLAAALQAGLHGVLHRAFGLGQVDHRQRHHGQADGDGWPPRDASRRRRGAKAPVERARVLQGTPGHQHPPHRLCRVRDHQERRHRDLRAHRTLHRHAPGRARDGRSLRRLRGGACGHLDRGMRTARPQGSLQACPRRQDQGVHRHLRPLRRADDRRTRGQYRGDRGRLLRAAGASEARKHGAGRRLSGIRYR
jgi:sulfate adenylyltransferase